MKKQLLKLLPLMCLLLSVLSSMAQSDKEAYNMVKFNALTLLGGKFSFEYERMINDRIAVGAALSMRPKAGLPLKGTVESFIKNDETASLVDDFKSSNFSFTPEVRFYLKDRGPFSGFYIAPYVKYASYNLELPLEYEIDDFVDENDFSFRTETIPLDGNIKAFTAGVSIGVNYKIAKNVYLDWRIIGPGYGFAKGNVTGKIALDNEEVDALREELADLKDDMGDLPLGIKLDYDVNNQGAEIKIKNSPWATIRSGLSIAYRF